MSGGRGRLARRLVVLILAVSSVITLAGTSLQLWMDYRRDRSALVRSLDTIETSFLGPLQDSLWESDAQQVRVQLEGMLAMPDVYAVTLERPDEAPLRMGGTTPDQNVHQCWTLARTYRGREVPLGELCAAVDLALPLQRLRDRVVLITATQATKTFLVTLFILAIFHRLVTRHVEALAVAVGRLGAGALDAPVTLERRGAGSRPPDELDALAAGLEDMRQQLAAALKESRVRLELVMASFPGVVWTTDGAGRLEQVAGAAAPLWFGDPHAAVGRPLAGLLAAAGLEADLPGAREGRGEVRLADRDFVLEARSLPEGRGHTLAVALDVTDRRALEAQRLEAQQLHAQKLESLGVLAGGIAHDFNNLLAGMLGNASLALMPGQGVTPGSSAELALTRVERAAQRAAHLVRQMLAYSGKGHFVVAPHDPSEVVLDTVDLLHSTLFTEVELELDLAADLPPVQVDLGQFQQVVMNLVTNAAQACRPAGGTVRVSTRLDAVRQGEPVGGPLDTAMAPGPCVVLEVSDDGVGMSAEVQRRMFDPFYSTKATGHGLGLAATQGIVRGHGGDIRVRSAPGEGTTLRVRLPVGRSDRGPDGAG